MSGLAAACGQLNAGYAKLVELLGEVIADGSMAGSRDSFG